MCKLLDLFKSKDIPGMERPSPGNWVKNELIADYLLGGFYRDANYQLRLHSQFLDIELSNDPLATPVSVTDTGSEDPIIDIEGNMVFIWGYTTEDSQKLINKLIVGDIACYQNRSGQLIMHRIFAITQDSEGRGFTFLGDNNMGIVDPGVVRDSQIKYIAIGTIY